MGVANKNSHATHADDPSPIYGTLPALKIPGYAPARVQLYITTVYRAPQERQHYGISSTLSSTLIDVASALLANNYVQDEQL